MRDRDGWYLFFASWLVLMSLVLAAVSCGEARATPPQAPMPPQAPPCRDHPAPSPAPAASHGWTYHAATDCYRHTTGWHWSARTRTYWRAESTPVYAPSYAPAPSVFQGGRLWGARFSGGANCAPGGG